MFAREHKAKFTHLVENEILKLNSVKVSFGLQVKFSIERNGETQHMEHYFREKELHVFNRHEKRGSTLTSTWTHGGDLAKQGFRTKKSFTAS